MPDEYAIYLRKSREDMEAEQRGEETDVLARHRAALLELAGQRHYAVGEIYNEVVSGDTVADRPEMLRLLADVEARRFRGVLVTEIERLARGDTMDQGLVAQTFKYSGTLIVTPAKTYDPSSDIDEEYFEFGLFMARREYKTIRRRLQAGRLSSVKEGNYLGPRAPFGYERHYLPGTRDWTLVAAPGKAEVVRGAFQWYAHGLEGRRVGADAIARRLNDLGFCTDLGKPFDGNRVRAMLKNPTYAGYVQWNQRKTVVGMQDGRRVKSRPRSDEYVLAQGKHEPIVEKALFERVQAMFRARVMPPVPQARPVVNPLSGLIKCGVCGKAIVLKRDANRPRGYLRCTTSRCPCVGIGADACEQEVLSALKGWLEAYGAPAQSPKSTPDARRAAEDERRRLLMQLDTVNGQAERLMDLLEQGVYSPEDYRARKAGLAARAGRIAAALDRLNAAMPGAEADAEPRVPAVGHVLDAYALAGSADEKNALLRTVVDHIVYTKTRRGSRQLPPEQYLTLDIFPLIPPLPPTSSEQRVLQPAPVPAAKLQQ